VCRILPDGKKEEQRLKPFFRKHNQKPAWPIDDKRYICYSKECGGFWCVADLQGLDFDDGEKNWEFRAPGNIEQDLHGKLPPLGGWVSGHPWDLSKRCGSPKLELKVASRHATPKGDSKVSTPRSTFSFSKPVIQKPAPVTLGAFKEKMKKQKRSVRSNRPARSALKAKR